MNWTIPILKLTIHILKWTTPILNWTTPILNWKMYRWRSSAFLIFQSVFVRKWNYSTTVVWNHLRCRSPVFNHTHRHTHTHTHTHIYIYICIYMCVCVCNVIHRWTVFLYYNSSVWLDTRDASSSDRNLADFLSVRYLTIVILKMKEFLRMPFYTYVIGYRESSILEKSYCVSAHVVAGKFPTRVLKYIYIREGGLKSL